MMDYTSSSDDEPEIGTLNISNDQYYRPVPQPARREPEKPDVPVRLRSIPKYGSCKISHSLAAYDLWKPFFPTYLSEAKFRNFHRPKLRHYHNAHRVGNHNRDHAEYPVKSLSRHMFRFHKAFKEKVIKAINDDLSREEIIENFFLLKGARELSAKTGEMYLFEYCEEYPPALSQVGMASNVTTYKYKTDIKLSSRVTPKQSISEDKENGDHSNSFCGSQIKQTGRFNRHGLNRRRLGYNEDVKSDRHAKQIYFHPMKPNTSLQVIENNMYRAPIFEHDLSRCDFIVIRTRNSFYIRPANGIFTVGQTMPLTTVPSPTEQQIHKFRCCLSNIYVHKLFKASETKPPSIDIDTLVKLFPDYHRSVLVKRLRNTGAVPGVIDHHQVFFKGVSGYGAIPIQDLRNMMRPEQYCVNMSMLAARQRLRELNYTESMIHANRGQNSELEPEVLAAPWNTSKAVISALKNQTYLDFGGHLIDPTGSREGFSCIMWSKSPTEQQQRSDQRHNSSPKPSFGKNTEMPLIKNPLRDKIIHEKLYRLAIYQKEAQHIHEIQSSSLALADDLTSDEDEDDIDNENISDITFSQQLEDLSLLVIGNKSVVELNHEKEEEIRRQMLADFKADELENRNADQVPNFLPKKAGEELTASSLKGKILIITRTYDYEGRMIQRSEIVRESRIIALYVKQRGGSINSDLKSSSHDNNSLFEDLGEQRDISSRSNGDTNSHAHHKGSSLGPSELCRADGTRLRISKKVLDECRPIRNCRK